MPPVKDDKTAQVPLMDEETLRIFKLKQKEATCFQCSKLCPIGYFMVCKEDRYSFTAIEQALVGCSHNDLLREKITGKAADLFRFMVLTQSVLQRSVPPRMLGAMGVLKSYGLIYKKKGKIRKGTVVGGQNFCLEDFVYLEQPKEIL